MSVNTNVIALIQARGGSKGIPRKNIRDFAGYPLLAWSVVACELSITIERIILSTDDEKIADVGRKYGAEVPFMRPAEFATDDATDYSTIKHALEWLRDNEGIMPELVVQIRPTTPLREPSILDDAVNLLRANPEATGLRSVFQMPETAWKCFEINDGYISSLASKLPDMPPDASNMPRQALRPTYISQGYVDILRSSIVLGEEQTYGEKVLGFLTPDCGEIDVESDFRKLEFFKTEFGGNIFNYLQANFP